MRTYTYQLAAGDERGLTIKGRYLRVLRATGTVRVRLSDDAPFEMAQGIGIHEPRGFTDVNVKSDTAQTVQIGVSNGVIDDNRLSLDSEISVRDQSYEKSLTGVAFESFSDSSSVVGLFAGAALYNPLGSGVNLAIKQIVVSAFTAGVIRVYGFTDPTRPGFTAQLPGSAKSMAVGAFSSLARGYGYSHAADPTTFVTHFWRYMRSAGNGTVVQNAQYPWIITPDSGVIVARGAVNSDISASFEYEEIPQ